MKFAPIVGACSIATLLVACGGSDVNISPSNVDNSVENAAPTPTVPVVEENPCASYTSDGVMVQGNQSGANCVYTSSFAGLNKPLLNSVSFVDLPNDGVHVFEDSLILGENYDNLEDLEAADIKEGGDGPSIRIEAGATLAFQSEEFYLIINRGSQIFAEGTAEKPITITSTSDAIDGNVEIDAVRQWGGMVINGFGVTNKCTYTGTRGEDDFAYGTPTGCNNVAEGADGKGTTNFGGLSDNDSSGVLKYFIVKHTGADVGNDNELNGISFNAVGSGTKVDYLQTHSTYDDGIEFFGGSVNVDHFVATFVRDDSIDIDEGYNGTITNALVIQSETDGNHCIESDGIGSYDAANDNADLVARGLNSEATIRNLTCIVSGQDEGTHDPGAGWRIREGHTPIIENAIMTTAYAADMRVDRDDNGNKTANNDSDGNYCLRMEHAETLEAAELAPPTLAIRSSIFACQDLTKGDALPSGLTQADYLAQPTLGNQVVVLDQGASANISDADADLVLLEDGFYSVDLDSDTAGIQVKVGGNSATVTPTNDATYIGGIAKSDNWIEGWAFGFDSGFWFQN